VADGRGSPWLYIGIGCLIVVLIGVLGVGACSIFVWRTGSSIMEVQENPESRAAAVREVLGADELPEGYHPAFVLAPSVAGFAPFKIAVLTDRPVGPSEDPEMIRQRGLLYFETPRLGADDERRFERFFGGEENVNLFDNANLQIDNQPVRLRGGEPIAVGTVELPGGTELRYRSERGAMGLGNQAQGLLTTAVWFRCPGRSAMQVAAWYGPDPAPDAAGAELEGTVADPARIRDFFAHFDLCAP
jgi:hypothetical protein